MPRLKTVGVFLLGVAVGVLLPLLFSVIEVLTRQNNRGVGHLAGPPHNRDATVKKEGVNFDSDQ